MYKQQYDSVTKHITQQHIIHKGKLRILHDWMMVPLTQFVSAIGYRACACVFRIRFVYLFCFQRILRAIGLKFCVRTIFILFQFIACYLNCQRVEWSRRSAF